MVYLLTLLIYGLIFYIYTIYCFKKKIVLYTIQKNLIILRDTHFKLQKKLGLINLIASILVGVSIFHVNKGFEGIFFILMLIFYWISNYIMKDISIRKGYSIMKVHI